MYLKRFSITTIKKHIHSIFWFLIGFVLTGVLLATSTLFYFQQLYKGKIYPGIFIDSLYVGEKKPDEIKSIYNDKNNIIQQNLFVFEYEDKMATVSAKDITLGYNTNLLADQAYSVGRSKDFFTNLYLVASSYFQGLRLVASYSYDTDNFKKQLQTMHHEIEEEPIDALFSVENNKVVAFRESKDGRTIDYRKLDEIMDQELKKILLTRTPTTIHIAIPINIKPPAKSTDKANNLGIVELISEGNSAFAHSIPNRVYNVTLAASKINGILVAPDETFSFNQALGDISKFTGYKEAYVIKAGKTVLGDGGGVCQVSTTLFRALLNAGLPITERHAHAYRVGYYEQNSPPGLDATIYSPTIDLRFKNDTKNHILIQAAVDQDNYTLKFSLYGKKDGREVIVQKPIITSQSPPPSPEYHDDPNLPKGQLKQIDYAANGARVKFDRTVKKDGKVLYQDTFVSNYTPWRAVYLRGIKES